MTPQDTARAIVEKIAATLNAHHSTAGLDVDEWVALAVPEVENLHAEAIRRAEAAEKDLRVQAVEINCATEGIRQLKAEVERAEKERAETQKAFEEQNERLGQAIERANGAEKERDELREELRDLQWEAGKLREERDHARGEKRLFANALSAEAERVRDLEAGLLAFSFDVPKGWLPGVGDVRNITVTEETYQRARALLSPPARAPARGLLLHGGRGVVGRSSALSPRPSHEDGGAEASSRPP